MFPSAPPRETLRCEGNKINCFPLDHSLSVNYTMAKLEVTCTSSFFCFIPLTLAGYEMIKVNSNPMLACVIIALNIFSSMIIICMEKI